MHRDKNGKWEQNPVLAPWLEFLTTALYIKPEPECLQCISTVLGSTSIVVNRGDKSPHPKSLTLIPVKKNL